MDDTEQLIRERAYLLWEADGRPDGRDLDYWERARSLVDGDREVKAAQPPKAKGKRAANGQSAPPPAEPPPAPKRARPRPAKPKGTNPASP